MPKVARKLHELVPVEKDRGNAYVWWKNRWHFLGPWDHRTKGPSAEAEARFQKLKSLWRVDPLATGRVTADDPLLIEIWRDWLASPQAPVGREGDTDRVKRLLFGSIDKPGPHLLTRASAFGAKDLLGWQSYLCELRTDTGKLQLGRDTVMRCVNLVRQCYAWAVIVGKVDQLLAAALTLVEPPPRGKVKERVKRKGIPRDAVDAVLPHLTPPVAAAVELLWLTCARPSELLGLRIRDVVRGGMIFTPASVELDLDQLGVWAAVMHRHKTSEDGFDRVLFFGPKSQAVLGPFLEYPDTDAFIFRPMDGRTDWAKRMRTRRRCVVKYSYGNRKPPVGDAGQVKPGERYDSGAIRNAVIRACRDRAEIPIWTPYQIRHATFKRVQAVYGRDGARCYGGHKVGGVTENYAGSDLMTAAKIAREIG